MGEVYLADDVELGRAVAVKFLRPMSAEAASTRRAERFLQEARAAASLSHPGLPAIFRFGLAGGRPYLAMEWIDGATLEALIAERGKLPVDVVLRLAAQVLATLELVHDAGIVHRDLKPSNLMLTRSGDVKVMDFGVARLPEAVVETAAGTILGTPLYAAPEQLAGHRVDARADLYALACVLYEAATGYPPYNGASLYEILELQRQGAPPAPSSLSRVISPMLDAVLLRALAIEPQRRYGSAREFAKALRACVDDDAVRPRLAHGSAASLGGTSVHSAHDSMLRIVLETVAAWPSLAIERQETRTLLERLTERPLHAEAASGALRVGSACVLVHDGLVYGAFDAERGHLDDEVIERLPATVEATFHRRPQELEGRAIALLCAASRLGPPQGGKLDSRFVDLERLASTLESEQFEGVMRLAQGTSVGAILFAKGRRVLELYGRGFGAIGDVVRRSSVLAVTEPLRIELPTLSYRQQLRDLRLEVVRPEERGAEPLRRDAKADAAALELRPQARLPELLRRTESTCCSILSADPAQALARWALVELPFSFQQHDRARRWRALVEPLHEVREVRLHHSAPSGEGSTDCFDVALYGGAERSLRHVIERGSVVDVGKMERFIARVALLRRRHAELGAAILVAPRFEDSALDAYLRAIRRPAGRLQAVLDSFSHREGYLRVDGKLGVHVLLVESAGGALRPLVFE